MKEFINDKTIYVVSSAFKNEMLKYIRDHKLLLDIHFFTSNEFIKRCYFDYDYKAIYHTHKKFNLSFSNAKLYIENIKYLMYSNPINTSNYNYLKEIKDYLDEMNLLQYDTGFIKYISNYKIVTDLDFASPFLLKINSLLDEKIIFINNDIKENISINKYKDSENEIEDVCNKIASLLVSGVDSDSIHIFNYSDAYYSYVQKVFTMYNIPFSLESNAYLYDLSYVKNIYNNYLKTKELVLDDNYIDINNSVIDIINNLSFIDDFDSKCNYLLYLLKNTKLKNMRYSNVINFDKEIGYLLKNHYYFFIGLNNKVFPNYKKDEDYFSDIDKIQLGYNTSYNLNKRIKSFYINKLRADVNLNVSFRDCDYSNKYLKSDIVDAISDNIIDCKKENKYSLKYNKLKLARELDNYYKYNVKSEELEKLINILDKKEYKTYDNSYTNIDANDYIEKTKDNKISVSYSSLEKYNECNFKYYLSSILNDNTNNFNTYIGSLFHHILEKIYDDDFNFDREIKSFSSDYIPSKLETILLNNLLEDFKEKISLILDQYKRTDFKSIKKELHVSIYKKTNLSINIHGFIDKIMFDNSNNAIIIDYKTGETTLTLKYLDYGLKSQLPFYFYLLNKSKDYADIFLVGCYLQVLNFKIKSINNKSKDMQLDGYSYDNEKMIYKIDYFYKENSYIKGINPNKNGLGTHAKLFDNDLFKDIVRKVEVNVEKMIDGVSKANFEINPKILKDNSTTCKYCTYKDICFHTFNNYIDLREGNEDEVDE